MITLIDGPEAGITLHITRPARFLRIVHNGGHVAALDQLDQQPEETELVFVYQRIGPLPADKQNPTADYRFHTPQPPDRRARHPYGWEAWVREQLLEPSTT